MPAPEFTTSVERLLTEIGHWQQGRWSTRPPGAPRSAPSRSDTVYALVQRLADLCADAEHRPRRRVPRLSDLVLRDQVRVMADDLLATSSGEAIQQATDAVDAARRAL